MSHDLAPSAQRRRLVLNGGSVSRFRGFDFSLLPGDVQFEILYTFMLGESESSMTREIFDARVTLNRLLTVRLITKPCAALWKEQACTVAYKLLYQKRGADRNAQRPQIGLVDTMAPTVGQLCALTYGLMEAADKMALMTYTAMAKGNPDAALAGLKVLVELDKTQKLEHGMLQEAQSEAAE